MNLETAKDNLIIKPMVDDYTIYEDYRLDCFEDGYDSAIKHLWLNTIQGVDASHIIHLKKTLGNVWNIYDASEKVISGIIPEQAAKKIAHAKGGGKVVELYDRLKEKGIEFIYPEKSGYPNKLRHISIPPQLLYVKGRIKKCIDEYNRTIGIVGSRNPSQYGKEICRYFSEALSEAGFNVISGLARGIDGIAHRSALNKNAYTVAVLGSGINVAYPRSNIELYTQIEENGAIVSEYGLDVAPNPWQFPIRNRIISGLSDGILVVEARAESGSLITVDHALEQGRFVYSIPGRIMDKSSEGNNNIIREGAICVTKPEDIIEDMVGLYCDESNKPIDRKNKLEINSNKTNGVTVKNELTSEESLVLSVMSLEPMYIDDIIQKTKIGVTKAISTLYILEKKKLIKQPNQGYYILFI
ncbi:MAG: DNA-processing protein DprA [Lachnospiraceae bacterium]|nr:DNA-processing protein DprA [Lachnospiraceae bacterium]